MKVEKLGVLDLQKISTGNWVNSLWKVDEFALEIEAICTGNWMNLYWEFDEFVVGIFLKGDEPLIQNCIWFQQPHSWTKAKSFAEIDAYSLSKFSHSCKKTSEMLNLLAIS